MLSSKADSRNQPRKKAYRYLPQLSSSLSQMRKLCEDPLPMSHPSRPDNFLDELQQVPFSSSVFRTLPLNRMKRESPKKTHVSDGIYYPNALREKNLSSLNPNAMIVEVPKRSNGQDRKASYQRTKKT